MAGQDNFGHGDSYQPTARELARQQDRMESKLDLMRQENAESYKSLNEKINSLELAYAKIDLTQYVKVNEYNTFKSSVDPIINWFWKALVALCGIAGTAIWASLSKGQHG
jgi:hypothetical protein